ncbi:P-loop containing nucleoside triphosphate hydrolase protein [Auriculariales sp. MPI-PUGE-AT-0066]|nr:P-loop containing nucleoside triphosphate hydrolase protein [Auriculariales sp. MPI-PUGE-AT-0066]
MLLRPKLSTSLAVYEGFKVVVQGLANMTDGAPWPWKAIPQTVLQFTSMVERALDQPQKVRDLTDRIARRIALLLNISQNKGVNNPELDAYVELFLADVQRIILRLRIIEKTHPAKAFPLTDHIDAIIAGEAEKMQTALQELQVRFAVHTAYGVDATKTMVTEIHASVVGSSSQQALHISTRARLPARPSCFKGRTTQLSALVKLVCNSLNVRIAIMGPGGMGKTSLAKAILHEEEVVNVLQDNRFFVSVEDVIDIESAAKRLAEQLGVGDTSDPQSAAISALQTLSRSLLVIDNLETLWFSNNAAAQKDTERFLQRLADVPSLTLIVTSRGSVTPSGIEWTNDQSAELEAISLEAAQETFEQIAGRPSLATELAALGQLLACVDCMPLAVTLLAQLARQKNSPSQLLQRWHHSKTTFIRAGGDHRESSVNVSIQISLDLLSGMTGGSEGCQLLSICAHLADGLRLPVFAQLVAHFSDIHAARDLLVTFALITVGLNDELRMLSPVRHFVLKHLPMTAGHLAALREIYFAIAASGPLLADENFSQLAKNVAPEYGNLTSFLLHLIETEEPSQELYDAVDRVSEYSYYTVPSPTLREAFRLRLTTHPAWLANCLFDLGRTRFMRDEYSLATDNFQATRKLYATFGNRILRRDAGSFSGNVCGCRVRLRPPSGSCMPRETRSSS